MPICPECGSHHTKEAHSGFSGKEGFVVVRDRVCKDCGHEFTPPIPAWAPYLVLLAGVALVAMGVGATYLFFFTRDGGGRPRAAVLVGVLVFGGVALCVKAVAMLRGDDSDNTIF